VIATWHCEAGGTAPLKYRLHHLIFSILLAGTSAAPAQEQPRKAGGLIAPAEVVLYIQSDLKRTDFVHPLVCALQRVLTVPVFAQTLELPLGSELRATPTQFDVAKVADRFIEWTAGEGNAPSFKYLLIPFDMKVEPWRYAFSMSFGDQTTSYHAGVVSTARLVAGNPGQLSRRDSELTATRAYKLILKSIARIAGHRGTDACILAFPNSLDELDRKSSEFCPEDRAALVAAGILKEKEEQDGPGCMAVARRSLPALLATAAREAD
jgi:predicted Zn-dependent protease